MNTNLTRLHKEAMIKIDSHGAFGEPETISTLDTEKFAKLIVKECIKIIENSDGDLDFAIFNINKKFGS